MLDLEIWHPHQRVLAFVLSRTNFAFLRFWISTFVILVFLPLLCLAMDLGPTTCCKVSSTSLCTCITDMSCVKTPSHLRIDALLE